VYSISEFQQDNVHVYEMRSLAHGV